MAESYTKPALTGKLSRLTITIIFLFVFGFLQTSLSGDKIKIKLHQPPPNKLGAGSLWKLDITNTTKDNLTIYLEGTVTEEKNGLIVEGSSKPFTVKPGKSTYGYDDFKSGEVSWKNKKSEEALLRTGNVLNGTYTICITAFYNDGSTAENEICITQQINNDSPGAIIPVSPADGETIPHGTEITFMWTGIDVKPPYIFRLFNEKSGMPQEELINSQKPVYVKKVKENLYRANFTKLVAGKKYIWFITDEKGEIVSNIFRVSIALKPQILPMKTPNCVLKSGSNLTDTLVSPTTNDLFGVTAFGPAIAYASGENGTIIKTLNGGINWFAQVSGTGVDLKGIEVISVDTAITVGESGTVLWTGDKGLSWNSVTSGTPSNLNSVCFPNKLTGFACGNNGTIIKSTTSGVTWDTLNSPTDSALYCINFVNVNTGIAVGSGGVIARTTTGGINWILQTTGTDLYGVDFLDSRVFAVGAGGMIKKSTDYGATWVNDASPTASDLMSVKFAMEKIAYAVGKNGANCFYNGSAWQLRNPVTLSDHYGVFSDNFGDSIPSNPSAYVISEDGNIYFNNPDTCGGPVVSFEYSVSDTSCNWCIILTGNINNLSTPLPMLLVSSSASFGWEACNPGQMTIAGYVIHEQFGIVVKFPHNLSDPLNIKFIFNYSSIFPANSRFYLCDDELTNACYIEFDDIMCCQPCAESK